MKEEHQRIVEDYQTGKYTLGDLANKHSYSRHNVKYILKKAGIEIARPKPVGRRRIITDEQLKELRMYQAQGIKPTRIAELLGLSPGIVKNWLYMYTEPVNELKHVEEAKARSKELKEVSFAGFRVANEPEKRRASEVVTYTLTGEKIAELFKGVKPYKKPAYTGIYTLGA